MSTDGNLRTLFRSHVPGHWQSIETAATGQGVPDSNLCLEGTEVWVEFKMTRAWAVRFKSTQPGWITRRVKNGGRVYIAVRRWAMPGGTNEFDELWVVPGRLVVPLVNHGLRAVELESLRMVGGSRKWDWGKVARLLIS